MFEEIKKIKTNFLNNLDKANSYNISKDILKDFKNIVNHKTFLSSIFLVSLYSNTVQAVELDSEALKSKLLASTIEHVEYKKNNFLTISENNINSLKSINLSKVENPFFSKNIVLVTKDKDYSNLKKENHAAIGYGSVYKINSLNNQKLTLNNGVDSFKHIVYINEDQLSMFEKGFKMENKNHVYPLFLLHELAHSSFEQSSFTSVNPSYKKFGQIQIEIHADVSAVLMYSKLKNMNKNESVSLIDDLIQFRLNSTIYNNDWKHDSTLALLELKNRFQNNNIKISNFNKNEISPYSAQLTQEAFNKNYSNELKEIFDKEKIPHNQAGILTVLMDIKSKSIKHSSLSMKERYFQELSKVVTKKDISTLNDTEILFVSSKIENQFNKVTPALVTYFSRYYQDGYKDLLGLNKKNNSKLALKI